MHKRTDTTTSTLVTRALGLVRDRGIAGAAHDLYLCGVPIEIAIRVLTRPPAQRRHT